MDSLTWGDTTNAELLRNKNAFYQRGGFPSVIGCVDGTHIRIQAPHYDENGYVNRKGFHSINIQGICNTEGKLRQLISKYGILFLHVLHIRLTRGDSLSRHVYKRSGSLAWKCSR